MFKKNCEHLQDDLFNHYRTMKPNIAKMLDKSWAPIFYEEVFCKINEDIYAPLYCLDNGRPNTPVNILLSLEVVKHQFGYTDQEDILFQQFEILTHNFVTKTGLKTHEQRMDSTLVSPNIKKAGTGSLWPTMFFIRQLGASPKVY